MEPSTPARAQRLLVTGASGYIGERLLRAARARGFEVVAAVRGRTRTVSGAAETRGFDLTDPASADGVLHGIDAVIHLAVILDERELAAAGGEDPNLAGTRRLVEAARRRGVSRFIFLSSQSAAADSPTRYGRTKWEVEQLLDAPGECAVRTGLVSGGPPRGLYGVLARLVRHLPVLPVIRPRAPIHPIHVDDLCAGLLSLAAAPGEPPHLVRLAAAEPVPFADYVRRLARCRYGRRVRVLPVPGRLALYAARALSFFPFLPQPSRERLLGLLALRPFDPGALPGPPQAPPLSDLGLELAAEGRRRRLLAEGRALTRYVLGDAATSGTWRRYARAVLAEHDSEPLDLPLALLAWPALIRTLEPLGAASGDALARRLSLATRIVEMTPEAAEHFHSYAARSRLAAFLALAGIVGLEGLFFPTRVLATLGRRWRARRSAADQST